MDEKGRLQSGFFPAWVGCHFVATLTGAIQCRHAGHRFCRNGCGLEEAKVLRKSRFVSLRTGAASLHQSEENKPGSKDPD
jgi:hypothetical protein